MKRIITFFPLLFVGTILGFAQTLPESGSYREEGVASWYGEEFQGRQTASGEIFDPKDFTAAHPTLQYGTILTVTNRVNNKQVQVRVNDRGPFVPTRIIDVSKAAAEKLDMIQAGTAEVLIEIAPRPYPSSGQPLNITEGSLANATVIDIREQSPPSSEYPRQQPQGAPRPQDSSAAPVPQRQDSSARQAGAPAQQAQIPVTTRAPVPPANAGGGVPRPTTPVTMTPSNPRVPNPAAPAYAPQLPSTASTVVRPAPSSNMPQSPAAMPQSPAVRQPVPAAPQPTAQQRVPATAPLPQSPVSPAAAPRQAAPSSPQNMMPQQSAPQPRVVDTIPPPQQIAPLPQSQLPPATILGGPIIPGRVYRIQVGAFKEASNAMKTYNKLISSGFNPQWERFEGYFRVVLTGVRSEDIPVVAAKLGGAGFAEAVARLEGIDVRE